MADLRQTAFRLSEEDIERIDSLRAMTGVHNRSEVVRMAIKTLLELQHVKQDVPPAAPARKKAAKAAA